MPLNVWFAELTRLYLQTCPAAPYPEAAQQCAAGESLYELADFMFRGFSLDRSQLATAPWIAEQKPINQRSQIRRFTVQG